MLVASLQASSVSIWGSHIKVSDFILRRVLYWPELCLKTLRDFENQENHLNYQIDLTENRAIPSTSHLGTTGQISNTDMTSSRNICTQNTSRHETNSHLCKRQDETQSHADETLSRPITRPNQPIFNEIISNPQPQQLKFTQPQNQANEKMEHIKVSTSQFSLLENTSKKNPEDFCLGRKTPASPSNNGFIPCVNGESPLDLNLASFMHPVTPDIIYSWLGWWIMYL